MILKWKLICFKNQRWSWNKVYYLDTLTTDRDLTEIAYSYVYPKLIEKKLWRDAMTMLDTLDLTELLTY